MSVTYSKLYFNSIIFATTALKADFQPNFICPNCKTKNVLPPKTSVTFQASKAFDFNQKIAFILPCCGVRVELFVAIHKNVSGTPMLCIQKSSGEGAGGILADWWVKSIG